MKTRPLAAACRLMLPVVAVLALGACSTMSRKPASYSEVLGQAESEVAAGRVESALIGFNEAARIDPVNKEPWLRSAQLQFDAGNYGHAIVAAEEVLQRDPADKVADSVLTVAGLRIASQSLQRLQGNGALASESARAEAERLAATMRDTMGEAFLAGPEASADKARASSRGRAAPRRRAVPRATPAAKPKSDIDNPFGVLGG